MAHCQKAHSSWSGWSSCSQEPRPAGLIGSGISHLAVLSFLARSWELDQGCNRHSCVERQHCPRHPDPLYHSPPPAMTHVQFIFPARTFFLVQKMLLNLEFNR